MIMVMETTRSLVHAQDGAKYSPWFVVKRINRVVTIMLGEPLYLNATRKIITYKQEKVN